MILMAPPIVEAVESVREGERTPVVLLTPQGERLGEEMVLQLIADLEDARELILICGHYKGVDERVRQLVVNREISIGDYVLSGGELPALVLIDALVRRLPGALNDSESAASDSFTTNRGGGLDCPWYTKPPEYRGLTVPDVLLSGHHANIEAWRIEQAARSTAAKRADLTDSKRSEPPTGTGRGGAGNS
jgi:tRNA (guanine37-N1)-methyltransferase